jgi:hypothetical protein
MHFITYICNELHKILEEAITKNIDYNLPIYALQRHDSKKLVSSTKAGHYDEFQSRIK